MHSHNATVLPMPDHAPPQFTAKYSAMLIHTHDYDKAAMRDLARTATSIEELVVMLTQLIELCRQHPVELRRELSSVSTLLAGVNKCIALRQPVRAALFVFEETHQKLVGATVVDHTAIDASLKNLKKLGGHTVVAEFPGWNQGTGGGGRGGAYRAPRGPPPASGRFSAGRGFHGHLQNHYAPPRRGGGFPSRREGPFSAGAGRGRRRPGSEGGLCTLRRSGSERGPPAQLLS